MKRMEPPADHEQRVEQARARADWELGDSSWADVILLAYLDPDPDAEKMKEEGA